MTDLSTKYLGLELKSPLIASSSPLLKKVADVQRMEEAGIGAVVLYSLFEEQVTHESLELHHQLSRSENLTSEGLGYLPESGTYSLLPYQYVKIIESLKKAVKIPIIGSLNGVSKGGWVQYARQIQDAGADALELNMYNLVTDPAKQAAEVENEQIELVTEVRSHIKIPLAIKLSPFYSALPHFVQRLAGAGANGLVLFNRFYQPDFDIDELEVIHTLDLSVPAELRLPLRWIALLYGTVDVDFALTSGIHDHVGVLKAMMAGAKAAMLASELLHNGIGRISEILRDLEGWMVEHEYESIAMMQGSMSHRSAPTPAALERANYMKVLNSFRDLP
jgi:dihydroorotate dehydrogenase (fumarate)